MHRSILVALLFGGFSIGQAATLTVPSGKPGFYTSYPFYDGLGFSTNGLRYQEVFAAAPFQTVATDPIRITAIALYSQGSLTNVGLQLGLHLSTTLKAPGTLSRTFAENVGSDDTMVFESLTPVPFSTSTDGQGRNVMQFPFQQPFVYRPESGNLLLDFYDFVNRPAGTYAGVANGPVSYVYVPDVDALMGVTGTGGLQVRFTYEAVPEPATVALFALGVCVFCAFGTKRRRPSW